MSVYCRISKFLNGKYWHWRQRDFQFLCWCGCHQCMLSLDVSGSLWEWNNLKRKTVRLFLRPLDPAGHIVMGTQWSTWAAFGRILVMTPFGPAWLYVCPPVSANELNRSWKFHCVGLFALTGMNPTKVLTGFPSISDTVGQHDFTSAVPILGKDLSSMAVTPVCQVRELPGSCFLSFSLTSHPQ